MTTNSFASRPPRRRPAALATLAALVALLGNALPARAVDAGGLAPDFRLPGTERPVQLTQLRGKWVYLDFWASWCAPCRESLPWMAQLQRRFGAHGLQVVAISVDSDVATAMRFLNTVPPGMTVAFDTQGTTPNQYQIQVMPTSMLIAPDGRVSMVHRGFRDGDKAALEQRVAAALGLPKDFGAVRK